MEMSGSRRSTQMSVEQQEIKNRPRGVLDNAGVLSFEGREIADKELFVDSGIPVEAFLTDITVVLYEISQKDCTVRISLRDGSMTESHSFKVKEGINKIDKQIKVFQGSVLQVSLRHPESVTAKRAYFSANVKK